MLLLICFNQNLLEAKCLQYTKAELNFAKELQNTIDKNVLERTQASYQQNQILFINVANRNAWKENPVYASSDSGDVSYIMPTGLFNTVCWPIIIAPHTWQATACAGSTIGEKGALYAAHIFCIFSIKPGSFNSGNSCTSPYFSIVLYSSFFSASSSTKINSTASSISV